MECRELLIDAFGRVEEDLRRCLDGLSAEQLAYRPVEEANSIGWLAWHLTRVQDDHMSDLAGRPQAWIEDKWHARFERPADAHDTGFGETAAQVAAFRASSAELLRDYYLAVHKSSIEYLNTLKAEDLDRELDEPQWETPVTVGVRLISVVNDCTEHVGQMAYIRGLIENRHWLPY